MRAAKKALKLVGFTLLISLCSVALWLAWWFAPVSVKAATIEKMNVPGVRQSQREDCAAFVMGPDEFRAYWKDARPIFEFEFHEYSFGSCYFKTTEDNKEFAVGIGGVGTVTKGADICYYVRKDAKPDLGP